MRDFPDWMPSSVKTRAKSMGYKSVREIERKAGLSNGRLEDFYKKDQTAITQMCRYLQSLGYLCQAPEFDVINGFCSQNIETSRSQSTTLSSVTNESQNIRNLLTGNSNYIDILSAA